MKKLRSILLILIACAVVFTGCVGKSNNLKLISSTKSASSFYFYGLREISLLEYNAFSSIDDSQIITYAMISAMSLQGQDIMLSVSSALDFCMAISDEEISNDTTQKIYEYSYDETELQAQKAVVIVDKKKGKSLYAAKQYEVMSEYEISELINQEPKSSFDFSISKDKTKNLYEFSDTKNKISGDFKYEKSSGVMLVNISFYSSALGTEQKYDISLEFYNYQNQTIGGRIITKSLWSGQSATFIYEFLSKPFAKKAKVGIVRDPKLMLDLTQVEESDVAKYNSGDSYGFNVIYENEKDSITNTIVKPYGMIPKD